MFPKLPKQLLIAILGLVALLAGCLLVYPHAAICSHADSLAYWSASKSFFIGENPYDKKSLLLIQGPFCSVLDPIPVWNPPLFFSSLGFFFITYPYLPYGLFAFAFIFAAVILFELGRRMANRSDLRAIELILVVFSAFPLLSTVQSGQIASLVAAGACGGFYLIQKKRFTLGGVCLAFVLIKPHLFIYPLFWAVTAIPKADLRKTFISLGTTVVSLSCLAEFFNSGIHIRWILRDRWPGADLGIGAANAMRMLFVETRFPDVMPLVLLCVGVLIAYATINYFLFDSKRRSEESFFVFLILGLIFAPYGFIFDQIAVVMVQSYLIARCAREQERRIFLSCVVAANVVCLLCQTMPQEFLILSWNLLPIITLLLLLISLKISIKSPRSLLKIKRTDKSR